MVVFYIITFQFLVVRLEGRTYISARITNTFQFLVVRLEVVDLVQTENGFADFNSLWCD